MNIKRISLTVFFMLLTFSIGLVSVNLPLTSYAQNSALSQSGNGNSGEETGQIQSSEQNGQTVSGDSSILSGNNLSCQNQANSEILDQICNFDTGVGGSEPPVFVLLKVDVVQGFDKGPISIFGVQRDQLVFAGRVSEPTNSWNLPLYPDNIVIGIASQNGHVITAESTKFFCLPPITMGNICTGEIRNTPGQEYFIRISQ